MDPDFNSITEQQISDFRRVMTEMAQRHQVAVVVTAVEQMRRLEQLVPERPPSRRRRWLGAGLRLITLPARVLVVRPVYAALQRRKARRVIEYRRTAAGRRQRIIEVVPTQSDTSGRPHQQLISAPAERRRREE